MENEKRSLKFSGWTIAAFVIGIVAAFLYPLGVSFVGLLICVVARKQFDPHRHRGKWMLIAAEIINALYTLMFVLWILNVRRD